jgi:hypothetical protein
VRTLARTPSSVQGCGRASGLSRAARLVYILLSPALVNKVTAAGVFRQGVWGGKAGTLFPHNPTMSEQVHQASDHAALFADIAL